MEEETAIHAAHIVGRRECFRLLSTLPPPLAHPRNNNTLRARRQCHTVHTRTRLAHSIGGPIPRGLLWWRGGSFGEEGVGWQFSSSAAAA